MTEKEIRTKILDDYETMNETERKIFRNLVDNLLLSDDRKPDATEIREYYDSEDPDGFTPKESPIDRAITLFECWRMRDEERKDLGKIFRIALQMEDQDATEEDVTELIGFVGALRMIGQI